ncbi:unnamed protein product, partial [Mesorhabditis spiculigera]
MIRFRLADDENQICRIAAKLAEGKTDPYCIDWAKSTEPFWLIRRGPLSREGLLIGVRRESIFLIGCDYNLRRHRTQPECEGFVLDEVPYHEDLTQKECLAIALEERAKVYPPDTVPMRERAIDRLLCPQFDWGPYHKAYKLTFELPSRDDPILAAYRALFAARL